MKRLFELIPLLLVIIVTSFALFKINQGLVGSLEAYLMFTTTIALFAFKMHLNIKVQPNYTKLYKEELKGILDEVNQIKSDYGKVTIQQNREARKQEFKF
jgi:hypothetical protein